MQAELDGDFVHLELFGKDQDFVGALDDALAQDVITAFNRVGGATMVDGPVLFWRKNVVVTPK